MTSLRKLVILLILISTGTIAFGQDVAMADTMREEGKIYVVVGVLIIIFSVLFAYLISLDLKLRKLEKEEKDK